MTAIDPVAHLIEAVRVPFDRARAMPPEVYTSQAFLERELSDVFARDWVCVGRVDSLPEVGDYLTYELAGQPIFVIRDADGALRAMSNVCLHRMSTLLEGSGQPQDHRLPLSRLVLRIGRRPARRAGHGAQRGLLQEELSPAADPL